ncbi:putative zinc protease [Starkeya nomas]|uniref:Insulinase family protein n=2 Tax=Xanthobacteraceae TaxID=335928 RepID=A0ABY3DV12_9HYPH|nr:MULTISPECIES: pitrilysin family protein [Xanthobacteraceae]TSJ64274.1 insulinase family protein [Ancylobacter moscoviensis]CAA0110878.1 putative zinc protease [Starkeya nomas]
MPALMLIAGAAAGAAGLAAAAPRAEAAEVSEFTLDNGMQVVVVPDHRAPVVTHMVWYRVGSADEQPGKSGIAHFLEHLMFKGTATHPAGEFSQVVSKLGGQENAFTSQDYTAYFQRVAKQHLGTVMGFEADRMTGLVLTDEVVLPERDVVLEERRMRTDNDPSAQLSEAAQAAMYVNHPYGHPIIGWEDEIKQLNREDALAFYQRFYTPNNAILVVAGDVEPDEVKKLAEETYGKVKPRAEIAERERPREPASRAERRLVLADGRVGQPALSRNYLVPAFRNDKQESVALDVLSQVLGGATGRLYRSLVVEKGLAASAGAWYQSTALDDTRFGIAVTPRPEVTMEVLEKALDETLAALAKDGPDAGELERAKTRLVADAVYAQDNQATLARIYGAALATGSTAEDVKDWPDQVKRVTAEEVRDAARRWLVPARAVTSQLLPAGPASGPTPAAVAPPAESGHARPEDRS